MMNAGDLDREIILQTATRTQNSQTGEEVIDWDELDETIWAQWLPGNTREAYFAQQRQAAHLDGVFRIYDRSPRPTPESHRIVFEDREYDITGVSEIGRGEGLELSVVARAEAPA